MTAVTNYGSLFTFNSVSIGKCRVTGFPEIATDKAPTTNHSSGGFAESIPTGLITIGDMKLSLLNEAGVLSALRTLLVNKTVATAVVTNGIDTITGQGYILSVQPKDADAEAPKANELDVVVAATGTWTVS